MERIIQLLTLLLLLICSQVSATTVRYQHTDMLGSVVAESDSAGNIISRSHYEPFGKRLGGDKAGIGYTGHLQDEDLNLTYMQARYYDPLIGRFYANDPIGFRDVHSFNRYAYGNNNPYKYVDPDGEASQAVVLPRERGKTFVYPKSSHAHAAKRHASGFKGSNTGTSSNQFKSALGMSSYEVSAAVVTAVVEAGAEYYQPSRGSSVYTAETGVSVGENGETKVSVATKEFRLLSDNALKSEVVSMLSEAGIEAGPNNVNIQNVEVVTTIAPDDGSFKSNDAVKMREQVEASK